MKFLNCLVVSVTLGFSGFASAAVSTSTPSLSCSFALDGVAAKFSGVLDESGRPSLNAIVPHLDLGHGHWARIFLYVTSRTYNFTRGSLAELDVIVESDVGNTNLMGPLLEVDGADLKVDGILNGSTSTQLSCSLTSNGV